jgi:hypothetical protein
MTPDDYTLLRAAYLLGVALLATLAIYGAHA